MRYIKYDYENESIWIEIDSDGYATRQVERDAKGCYRASCFEDCLAEGIIDENDFNDNTMVSVIDRSDFDNEWTMATKSMLLKWQSIKRNYVIGMQILGYVTYFYPQGAIAKGEDFIAVYKGEKNLYIHEMHAFTVTGYDDINMWLIVDM